MTDQNKELKTLKISFNINYLAIMHAAAFGGLLDLPLETVFDNAKINWPVFENQSSFTSEQLALLLYAFLRNLKGGDDPKNIATVIGLMQDMHLHQASYQEKEEPINATV